MRSRLMRTLRGTGRTGVDDAAGGRMDARGPIVAARLADGPAAGVTMEVIAVEGRPPKTVDVDGPEGARSRYCLAEWDQSGHTADYTFLYDV